MMSGAALPSPLSVGKHAFKGALHADAVVIRPDAGLLDVVANERRVVPVVLEHDTGDRVPQRHIRAGCNLQEQDVLLPAAVRAAATVIVLRGSTTIIRPCASGVLPGYALRFLSAVLP